MIKEADIFKHREVDELDISDDLKNKIQTWDEEFQNTFDHNDPLGSGFAIEKLRDEHSQRGMQLRLDCRKN